MSYKELERDLAFIKKTMEAATTYRNVPAVGYLAAGILGLAGSLATYYLLGADKAADLSKIRGKDVDALSVLWAGIFILTLISVIACIIMNARKHGISAWNPLGARMFLSQIPLLFVAGVLTIALVHGKNYGLIPAAWLMCYGVMAHSFSYFTGIDHRIQGLVFIVLGAGAAFAQGTAALILLAVGFGGVHIIFGVYRLLRPSATA